MQDEERLISIFTPSVLMDLTCLPLVDQKELAKTRLEMKKGEGGPRSVRGKILCFPQLCICVLKTCGLIPWKHFPLYFFFFSSLPAPSGPIFKNGNCYSI